MKWLQKVFLINLQDILGFRKWLLAAVPLTPSFTPQPPLNAPLLCSYTQQVGRRAGKECWGHGQALAVVTASEGRQNEGWNIPPTLPPPTSSRHVSTQPEVNLLVGGNTARAGPWRKCPESHLLRRQSTAKSVTAT